MTTKMFEITCTYDDFTGTFKQHDLQTVEACTQGRRETMEDATLVMNFQVNESPVRVLAIFDGHGGSKVSSMLQQEFGQILQEKMTDLSRSSIETWIRETFREIHRKSPPGGSTAIVAVIFNGTACIANVGDSRALLITPNEFECLTEDANPCLPKYREEIESHGGFVTNGRVNGHLAVARFIGNRFLNLNQAIPDFTWIPIQPDDILLLACDGLFESCSNADIAMSVQFFENLETIARQLIIQGLKSGSGDNITVLLTDFHIDFEAI